MKIVLGIAVAGIVLNGATAATAATEPAAAATTVSMGCFSNACAATIDAAVKSGDAKAVLEAGGSAEQVVTAAINAQTLRGATVAGMAGPELLAKIKPGSAQFGGVNKDGQPSARVQLQDGGNLMMIWATVSLTQGAPAQSTALIYAIPPIPPSAP